MGVKILIYFLLNLLSMAAGKKISGQDQAATLVDADEIVLVQSGNTVRAPLRDPTGAVASLIDFIDPCGLNCAVLTIPFASVRLLNTTPILIVAAPGASLAIEFISGSVEIQFNAVAYATFTVVTFITNTATNTQAFTSTALSASGSAIYKFANNAGGGPGTTQIIANQDLNVSVTGGDPTAGDSTVIVRVMYRIISV